MIWLFLISGVGIGAAFGVWATAWYFERQFEGVWEAPAAEPSGIRLLPGVGRSYGTAQCFVFKGTAGGPLTQISGPDILETGDAADCETE